MLSLFKTKQRWRKDATGAEQVPETQLDAEKQLEIWLAHLRQRFGGHGAVLVNKMQSQPLKEWTPEFTMVVVKVIERMVTQHVCKSFPCGGHVGQDLETGEW